MVDPQLQQNDEVYRAVFRRLGGKYINVGQMPAPRVDGDLSGDYHGRLLGAMKVSALGLDLQVEQEKDALIVQRADGVAPVNESERLVLAFLAVLLSRDLRNHAVAAVAWDESGLAVLVKSTIWQLIRTQVVGKDFGPLEDLVFIAGGSVEPTIHCEHEHSVRYALSGQGLLKRKGRVSFQAAVGKLTSKARDRFVLFLGAGASASAGMPLGNHARDFALDRFFGGSVRGPIPELALRFHRWVEENGRLLEEEEVLNPGEFVKQLTLERVLREEFRRDGRDSSPTLRYLREKNDEAIKRKRTAERRALREILDKPNGLVIVTVNFDCILEDEFDDQIMVFATPEEFKSSLSYLERFSAGTDPTPVLKLHGTLADAGSIVADVDTRSFGLPPEAAASLRYLCGAASDQTPWVYVGASMRDPDITEVIGASDFAEGLDEWWVSPFPDPAVGLFAQKHRAPKWRKSERADLEMRQITETAGTFLSLLGEEWPKSPRSSR